MERNEQRWVARPAGAASLRVVVFVLPILASVIAAWIVLRLLPNPATNLGRVGQIAVVAGTSAVVLVGADRFTRRFLPLAALLELSLLFPGQAPRRFSLARAAIQRQPLELQLRRVREHGGDPAVAAREVVTLLAAMRGHDRPTRGHAERVRVYTDLIAEQLNLPERDRDLLRWAAILHDIGKLLIPTELLNKPGRPTETEWKVLRAHPKDGAELAGPLLNWLGEWGDVIVQHHERWDGSGYPEGLAGRSVTLGARIVAVADAYDVMTSSRPYQRPISRAAALRELTRAAGTQFDPAIVRATLAVSTPRLRRAQGLLAWLADVPLLAGNTVPAATLARAIGAGAVAATTLTTGQHAVPSSHAHPVAIGHRHTSPATPPSAGNTGVVVSQTGPAAVPAAIAATRAPGSPAPQPSGSPVVHPAQPTVAPTTGPPSVSPSAPLPSADGVVAAIASSLPSPLPGVVRDPLGTVASIGSSAVAGIVPAPVRAVLPGLEPVLPVDPPPSS